MVYKYLTPDYEDDFDDYDFDFDDYDDFDDEPDAEAATNVAPEEINEEVTE